MANFEMKRSRLQRSSNEKPENYTASLRNSTGEWKRVFFLAANYLKGTFLSPCWPFLIHVCFYLYQNCSYSNIGPEAGIMFRHEGKKKRSTWYPALYFTSCIWNKFLSCKYVVKINQYVKVNN